MKSSRKRSQGPKLKENAIRIITHLELQYEFESPYTEGGRARTDGADLLCMCRWDVTRCDSFQSSLTLTRTSSSGGHSLRLSECPHCYVSDLFQISLLKQTTHQTGRRRGRRRRRRYQCWSDISPEIHDMRYCTIARRREFRSNPRTAGPIDGRPRDHLACRVREFIATYQRDDGTSRLVCVQYGLDGGQQRGACGSMSGSEQMRKSGSECGAEDGKMMMDIVQMVRINN